MQNKKPFEMILHVRRVTSLQSWVAKKSCHGQTLTNVLFLTTLATLKACNSPYMQYYFKRFFVLHSSDVIFSFLIKKSRQKAIEIETAFLHTLGNPKSCTLDAFLLCFRCSRMYSSPVVSALVCSFPYRLQAIYLPLRISF